MARSKSEQLTPMDQLMPDGRGQHLVTSLARFEDIGFKVSAEEWKHGIEPAPELNFSAAGAAVRWGNGAFWSEVVGETRAEEGDLFRMFSRTGEALVQIAGLRRSHPQAAQMAEMAKMMFLKKLLMKRSSLRYSMIRLRSPSSLRHWIIVVLRNVNMPINWKELMQTGTMSATSERHRIVICHPARTSSR